MTGLSETKRWRQKYFDQLAVAEQEESRLRQLVSTLQSLVESLSVAAHGDDEAFDAELAELTASLRRDEPDLKSLDTLARRLKQAARHTDLERKAGADRFLGALCTLVDQLLAYELPADQRAALESLGAGMQQQANNLRAYPALLVEYGGLHARALQSLVASAPAPARIGFFERLFGGDRGGDRGGEAAAAVPPSDTAAAGSEATGATVDLNRLTAELRRLLEELSVLAGGPKEPERLQGQLAACRDEFQLLLLVEAITAWILGTFTRVQREFETYLVSLDTRLQQVQQLLVLSQANQNRSRTNNTELEAAMRRHVDEVQSSLAEVQDLDGLKRSVNAAMASILDSVAQFMASEAAREKSAVAELGELQARYRQMEADARELKRQVAEARRQADTDALSGLPNRAAYAGRVRQEFERWQRDGGALTMAVLDIDKLKAINDEFGHLAGDKVIQLVGREVSGMLRRSDFIARYGGEEFVILLPDTELDAATELMEKVRRQVAQLPFHFRDRSIRVTVSIGICDFADAEGVAGVFERADQALYGAKRRGRDRIVLAREVGGEKV